MLADELLAPVNEGSNVAFGNLPRGYKAVALSPHFHSVLFRPHFEPWSICHCGMEIITIMKLKVAREAVLQTVLSKSKYVEIS